MSHMPGLGDAETMPIGSYRHEDDEERQTDAEKAQALIGEIRRHLSLAHSAVYKRDWQEYRLQMADAHHLAGSIW